MNTFIMGESFEDIAKKTGFDEEKTKMFVWYMETRWKKKEEEMCQTGYAGEWALRFLHNLEFRASDIHGMRLLFSTGKYNHMSEEMQLQEEAAERLKEEGIIL